MSCYIIDSKKEKNTEEGAAKYSEIRKKIRNGMKKAKEDWIEEQCTEIKDCLTNNNSRRAYQVVKELTKQTQVKINTIQDKKGNASLKKKTLSTDGRSTVQNYATSRPKETPVSKPDKNCQTRTTFQFYLKKLRQP